jgi:5-methylcytosine-specific restriction endonuclease McrA
MTSRIIKNRLKAFQNQAGRCYYCGSIMWLNGKKEDFAAKHKIPIGEAGKLKCTAEHLEARCDGGDDSQDNIVAACLFCNNGRHLRKKPPAPNKYRDLIQKRLEKGKWHQRSIHHLVARPA